MATQKSALAGVGSAAVDSAAKLATAVAKLPEVAAEITNNATKTVENLSKISVIASETSAQPIGEAVGNVASAANEASKSLRTIAESANAALGSAKGILERTNQAIEDANERRKQLNIERLKLMKETEEDNIKTQVQEAIDANKRKLANSKSVTSRAEAEAEAKSKKAVAEAEAKSKKDLAASDAKLKSELEIIERERKKNDLKAQKIKDDFEKAQALYDSDSAITMENIFIATKDYGYMDQKLTKKGFYDPRSSKFGSTLNYFIGNTHGIFYRIVKLKINGDVKFGVKFNADESKGRIGYYVENNENKYYLNITNLFTNKISGSLIKNEDGAALDDKTYDIEASKVRFKIPNRGGRKTNKKRVKKNKRTRARRYR